MIDRAYRIYHAERVEKEKIKEPERQRILSQVILTPEHKKEIDNLYISTYGKKIPYDWHRLYTSYTGNFDARYIPELLFIPHIQERFVSQSSIDILSDKNLLPFLVNGISGVRTPSVFFSCEDGHFRDQEMNLLSRKDAVHYLWNLGECFAKPTKDSNSGKGCRALCIRNGIDLHSGESVSSILSSSGRNFNFQECLINVNSIKCLHPDSINTFRITSYIWDDKICFFPLVLRIGRGRNAVDNAHQGGMFIGVSDQGQLNKYAFTEFQERFEVHPDSGVVFMGHTIPEVPGILQAIRILHGRLAQIGMISWDITVDENGFVVVVEMNLDGQAIWVSQMANGKGAFGENTEAILRWISKKR